MLKHTLGRLLLPPMVASLLIVPAGTAGRVEAQQPPQQKSIVHKVTGTGGRLEMTVNTSRRLVMDQKIPEAQVNNPDLLDLTPLSPTSVQVSAKEPGVTQINLWGEDADEAFHVVPVLVDDAVPK